MKRSEINEIMKQAVQFIESLNFKLPPFAFWGLEEWNRKGKEYDEIKENMLGWDITDFGSNDFYKKGLLLFSIRNGNQQNKKYTKPYAEKLLITEEKQVTPCHFHWNKMEDIINRGGGNMMVRLYNSNEDGSLADTDVIVSIDGRVCIVPAGETVRLTPGESITLPVGVYHTFWAEEGYGRVLLGEVSMVNDDNTDNRFYEEIGRFPDVEDDVEPLYLLCNEYPKNI